MPREIEPGDIDPAGRFAIVVSQWNQAVTSKLLEGAVTTLVEQGVADQAIDVARVPGAWEIPVVAQRFAQSSSYVAILALGAVIRGETSHDQHINRAVSLALGRIGLQCNVPVLLGLLTCETMEQALDRAGGRVGNKGSECAEAALAMARLLANLPGA